MDSKLKKWLVAVTAISWSLVQLYCAVTYVLDILQVEMLHICFALILVFLLRPGPAFLNRKGWLDLFWAALALAVGIYFIVSYPRIIQRIRFVETDTFQKLCAISKCI